MASIYVTVTNAICETSGFIKLAENSTKEDAWNMLKSMVGGVNSLETLSLETTEGVVHVFPQGILKESIISASVIE